jgi:hypothetical protein
MNLSNSDREFFENLNNDLAKSLESALSKIDVGGGGSGGGDGGGGGVGIGKKIKGALVSGLKGGIGKVLSVASNQMHGAANNVLEFGNVLARSTAATNRTQILATKTINEQGKIVNGLPGVSDTFRKFGISTTKVARTLDDAIRANIKNTGATAQKFLATSQGLGNSLSTTNSFLATQTNVLGKSTQASTEFGNDILGLASSNGILADSIIEAVNAFTKTTRQQTALFGAESANLIQRFVAGAEATATGAGTANLIRALTSTEGILKMPALAGRLGIEAPTDVRDPEQMQRFLSEAIPAIAQMGQQEILGQDAATGQVLSEQLTAAFGEAFSLESFQTAALLMQELSENGKGIGELFSFQKMTGEELDEAQKNVTGASIEAATVLKDFNLEMAMVPSYMTAIRETADVFRNNMPTAAEIRESAAGALDLYAEVDAPLRTIGSSAKDATDALGKFTTALLFGAFSNIFTPMKGLIGRMGKGLFGKNGLLSRGFTGAKNLGSRALSGAKGLFSRGAGFIGRGLTGAKNLVGRGASFVANSKVGQFAKTVGGKIGGAAKGVGKYAVKNLKGVPLLSGAIPVIEEMMMEDGSIARGLMRGAGATLGSIGGGAIGSLAGPVGTAGGAIAGGIGGDALAASIYNRYFGGDDTAAAAEAASSGELNPGAMPYGPQVDMDVNAEVMDILNDQRLIQQAQLEMQEGIYTNGQGTFTSAAGSDMEYETGLTNR